MTVWISITCAVLAYTAAADLRERKIDRRSILLLVLLRLARPGSGPSELYRNACTALLVFLVLLAVYAVSGGRSFGGGDVRLLSAEAFLLRENELITALLISAGMLLLYCLYSRKKSGQDRQIPAAVFLCPGMILSLFVTGFVTAHLRM